MPGFVSYALLEVGRDALAMIAFFDDLSGLAEADLLTRAIPGQYQGALLPEPSRVVSGEVLFQRGM